MNNDINLLYKRDTKTYSGKKIATVFLLIIVIAAALYAGITIPSSQLASLKEKAAELDNTLGSSTSIQLELSDKSLQYKTLHVMLQEITALGDQKSDIIKYLDAVEKSLPTDAYITSLQFSDTVLSINGNAKNDTVLATFCLNLREQKALNKDKKMLKIFSNVYISDSTAADHGHSTDFGLTAILPYSLDSSKVIGAIEAAANPSASPSSSPSASPEVSN